MHGEQRCDGSKFQTTGAAIEKLCRPSLVVLIRETNRSPRTAKQTGMARESRSNYTSSV